MRDNTAPTRFNRREAFSLVAVTAAGGALLSQQAFAQETGAGDATSLMPGADVCVITPEVTEGPYYFDPALERADITEGHGGVATRIRLQVVDSACQPIHDARVDIWHANAEGLYSGYAGQGNDGDTDTTGQTFMRGTQMTDTHGIAEFATTYPGWYRGRTTHVHFKVFLDTSNVLTGQIFFPDALSEFLYERVAPYNARGAERDTLNTSDSIAQEATRGSFAYVKELADSYLVAMIVGVDPNATSSGFGGGFGGGRPNGSPPAGDDGNRPEPPTGGMSGGSNGRRDSGTLVPGVDGIN